MDISPTAKKFYICITLCFLFLSGFLVFVSYNYHPALCFLSYLSFLFLSAICVRLGIKHYDWLKSRLTAICLIFFINNWLASLLDVVARIANLLNFAPTSSLLQLGRAADILKLIIILTAFLSVYIAPILLAFAYRKMQFKNYWLLYPLLVGAGFDVIAGAASI